MSSKFLTVLILLIAAFNNIFAQCHIDDWTALKALYENTNGENWIDNTGWEIIFGETKPGNCNLENLYGIYVDETGRVTCIDLDGIDDCNYNFEATGNNLTGFIPSEIDKLSSLITLNLAINQITGNIPEEIGNLSNLRNLNLGGNLLVGNIPAEIGNLNNLVNLLLNSNKLSGNLPAELGNLSNLNYLSLYDNELTGSIPLEIGNLLNLGVLQLSFNQFTGVLPPEIGKLSNLFWLDIYFNSLSGSIPPEIGNLTMLKYLDLSYNQLTGILPPEIGNLKNLYFLGIHSNLINGNIPPQIGNLIELEDLNISYNQLSGLIPSSIGNLQKLIKLDLGANELSGAIPSTLGNLTKLTSLSLWLNNLSGCYPQSIYTLCSQIDTTSDSFDYISGGNNFAVTWDEFCANKAGICSAAKCNKSDWAALKKLYDNASGNNWNNNSGWVDLIENETELPGNCDLSQLWGVKLNTFGRVSGIDLSSNNLKGTIGNEINKLDSLVSLNLSHNTLIGSFPIEITDLKHLENLNFESIGLENEIPAEIENLKKLTTLNLSDNQLTGEIPQEIGTLTNLIEIQLNNNLLMGSIPNSFDDLFKLELLELANNSLTGCYPSYLNNFCNENYDGQTLVSDGNNFESTWGAFCNTQAGVCEESEPCDKEVWQALKALYKNTNGNSWTINTGWNTMFENKTEAPTVCDFNKLYGVESYPDVFNANNEVYLHILLSNNNLNGKIPVEIMALNNLSQLDLSKNQLNGSISGKLINADSYLYYLDLSDNNLTDSIPTNIVNHKNLSTINFRNNKLTGKIPAKIGELELLQFLILDDNELNGSIPLSITNLSKLESLSLSWNQLKGDVPRNLNKLTYLNYLNLSHNKLTNKIPPEIGELDSLEILYLNDNLLNSEIPVELFSLNKLRDLRLSNNQLIGNIPSEIDNSISLEILQLSRNQLNGSIPPKIGNLTNLISLMLDRNLLSGTLPESLSSLDKLSLLNVSYNQLSGYIPKFNINVANFLGIHILHNRFSCEDITTHFENNPDLDGTFYSPQYFTPANYDNIELNIIDSLQYGKAFEISVEHPEINSTDLTYQWVRNKYELPNTNQANYQVENILASIAGNYTLHINQNNCVFSRGSLKLISAPMYVIVKGHDLLGQPVEYDQIMVEFSDTIETTKYEDEILKPNAGFVKKACNCNRELYLWEFPGTEAAARALIEIDRKLKRLKSRNRAKGGFNNNISVGEKDNTPIANNILSDTYNESYTDSTLIFLLDTGLDTTEENFTLDKAPVDDCYNLEASPGYDYADASVTINTNYTDELWHGTFGYHSITEYLKDEAVLKVVPLKIFDKNGKGNLFDMACAMYHAIDHNADIINVSAGYYGEPSGILENAINIAREKGIFITAAVGNDTVKIDSIPQYPAYYAGKYNVFEWTDASGTVKLDSIKYDNVISVASISAQGHLSQFSNYGKHSTTIACYGENINGYGLDGLELIASGTSMSTFLTTKALALEIAKDKQRTYKQVWNDFENNWLISNPSLINVTQTGKQINFTLENVTTNIDRECTGFEMHPNPTNGMVQLTFSNHSTLPKQILVIDCLGKTVLSKKSPGKMIKLNLQAYPKGVYFIRINTAEKTIIQKLVLK